MPVQRSVEASEQERRRWARELHDETLQELAALRLLLSGARRGDDEARLREAVDDARRPHARSRSTACDGSSPTCARRSWTSWGSRRPSRPSPTGCATRPGWRWSPPPTSTSRPGARRTRLDDAVEIVVYRLIQEALTNVVKHAGATAVEVEVRECDGVVQITVRDDGRGFDPEDETEGFGLRGMQERVSPLGGRLGVESAPGAGTTVQAVLPARHRPEAPPAQRADLAAG